MPGSRADAEVRFRRALQISQGDYSVFLKRPITVSILAIAVIAFLAPAIWSIVRARGQRDAHMGHDQ